MHVVMSRFKVANGMRDEVRQAFLNRPGLVDRVPGFIRMDVLQGVDDPDEFWLYTVWSDAESFHAWHQSHHYQEAHRGIPGGLKVDKAFTRIQHFQHVCS